MSNHNSSEWYKPSPPEQEGRHPCQFSQALELSRLPICKWMQSRLASISFWATWWRPWLLSGPALVALKHCWRGTVVERRSLATFPLLSSTCSWWVTTYVGKPSATGQPCRPTQPFILLRSINWVVRCNRMFASSHGWWRLVNAYGVKAWCAWLERWCVC